LGYVDRRTRGCVDRSTRGRPRGSRADFLLQIAPDVSTTMNVLAILTEEALLFLVQAADLANWDGHGLPNLLLE